MQPFNQDESAYTATASTVTFSGAGTYDPAKLDNPVRSRVNALIVSANVRSFQLMQGAV